MFGLSWTQSFYFDDQLTKMELEPKEGWQQRCGNTYYVEKLPENPFDMKWMVYCWDNYDPRPSLLKTLNPIKVGVAVCMLNNENRILMGHRHPDLKHQGGTWSFPGGHLEFGEDPIDCAKREVLEETNIDLKSSNLVLWTVTNDIYSYAHYVTLVYFCKIGSEKQKSLKNMEPNKCLGWEWCDWNILPSPLMTPIKQIKETVHQLISIFEID